MCLGVLFLLSITQSVLLHPQVTLEISDQLTKQYSCWGISYIDLFFSW
jgi:hypothetical protein